LIFFFVRPSKFHGAPEVCCSSFGVHLAFLGDEFRKINAGAAGAGTREELIPGYANALPRKAIISRDLVTLMLHFTVTAFIRVFLLLSHRCPVFLLEHHGQDFSRLAARSEGCGLDRERTFLIT